MADALLCPGKMAIRGESLPVSNLFLLKSVNLLMRMEESTLSSARRECKSSQKTAVKQVVESMYIPSQPKRSWSRQIRSLPPTKSSLLLLWVGLPSGRVSPSYWFLLSPGHSKTSVFQLTSPVSERVARSFSSPDLRVHLGGDAA